MPTVAINPAQQHAGHRAIMLAAAVRSLDVRRDNLVSIAQLRRYMVRWGRQTFDNAVESARRAGLVTATALEGREGITAEERGAALREDGALLGYLSIRR